MNNGRIGTMVVLIAVASLWAFPAASQTQLSSSSDWTPPRTPDGQPNLQGLWTNNSATALERPEQFGDKAVLTDEEVAELTQRVNEFRDGDQAGDLLGDFLIQKALDPTFDPEFDKITGDYNAFWLVERALDNRTSLVVDPPNGRIPPLTDEAVTRLRGRSFASDSPAGPEEMGLNDRCISYGVPNLLQGYNSYFQILQTKDHVAILQELIHDARIIPLGDREHLDGDVRQLHGDSRAHFDGETLVVETTNYSGLGAFRGASEKVVVTERFTRVSDDTITYGITFEDPTTWTKPWTVMIPLKLSNEALYEYACHEGNYAMEGMLGGARRQEKTEPAR